MRRSLGDDLHLAALDLPALGAKLSQPPLVVVDEDNRAAVGEPLGHDAIQRRASRLVQPGPGLIEDQQTGARQQRLRHGHLLAHSL